MSMKRFGAAAIRIAAEVSARLGGKSSTIWTQLWPRIFPVSHNLGAHVVLRKAPLPILRQTTFRMGRLVARNGRIFRPFSSLIIERNRFDKNKIQIKKFAPLKQKKSELDFIEKIKEIFGSSVRYNEDLRKVDYPTRIEDYDFGEFLGQGCNAAVYSARIGKQPEINHGFNEISNILANKPPKMEKVAFKLKSHPLAIKLMFNYEHDRAGEEHLWSSMGNELAPYPKAKELIRGRMGNFKSLPKNHPNLVRITTAFVDSLKILPDAAERYPEALHTARWYESIALQPKTMYIVMKRYRQTLHEYIGAHRRNYWTGRVMLAQLLEGCTYLHQNFISQRDMKSDNILVHYDVEDEIPQVVISDFGCALCTGSWEVDYSTKDAYLGGNMKTRAPEIATATCGKGKKVNFEMADTWAAGALGYEILTRINPFYKELSSSTYQETDLPPLPIRINYVTKNVIQDLLKKDPKKRVKPNIAANAINLSLFRLGEDVKSLMKECGVSELTTLLSTSSEKLEKKANHSLDKLMSILTAETMMANLAPHLIGKAERQLRATFLSRINREEIWRSLHYFFSSNQSISFDAINCDSSLESLQLIYANESSGKQMTKFKNVRNIIESD